MELNLALGITVSGKNLNYTSSWGAVTLLLMNKVKWLVMSKPSQVYSGALRTGYSLRCAPLWPSRAFFCTIWMKKWLVICNLHTSLSDLYTTMQEQWVYLSSSVAWLAIQAYNGTSLIQLTQCVQVVWTQGWPLRSVQQYATNPNQNIQNNDIHCYLLCIN